MRLGGICPTVTIPAPLNADWGAGLSSRRKSLALGPMHEACWGHLLTAERENSPALKSYIPANTKLGRRRPLLSSALHSPSLWSSGNHDRRGKSAFNLLSDLPGVRPGPRFSLTL